MFDKDRGGCFFAHIKELSINHCHTEVGKERKEEPQEANTPFQTVPLDRAGRI